MSEEIRGETARNAAKSALEDLRIILWDIDGTLVRATRYGLFRDYMGPMLEKVFGTCGKLPEMIVSGMTDLQIAIEALREHGFTAEEVTARVDDIRRCYIAEMERIANGTVCWQPLPGARAALERLAAHPRYLSSLLTGNIEPAARLKLRVAGLDQYFQLPGAFGDESHDRRALPALAAKRINQLFGHKFAPQQFIIIGDTPNDIAAARHFGARVVAVATGRVHRAEDLRSHEPDALLPDLTDTDLLLRTLDRL
ncbi:MAG: hydrolase [Pyrinomonas sp.]|uniref:HAD family hydrolase n=1 Tax=Pyrinomonas sp. TaxID=2080306 RepID=UPI003327A0E3